MLVRSTTMMFIGGRRLRVDQGTGLTEPFEAPAYNEGDPLPHHLHPADGSAPARAAVKPVPGQANTLPKTGKLSKKEIMAQLSAAGVKYNATMTADALLELLNAEKAKAAPASSTAPAKDPAALPTTSAPSGTGNQDVI